MSEKASLNLTAEQLQQLISTAVATAVAEARKPLPPTESERLKAEQEEAMRKATGEQELAIQAGRKAFQRQCSHMQPSGKSAVASVRYVEAGIPQDALICVHCQAMIKPAKGPFDETGDRYIYDENLYYRLASLMQSTTF